MTCEHFGRCGGCAYLDISYEEELALKKRALAETLGEYAGMLGEIHPAPTVSGYRNKMEFAFGDESKDGALSLGIRKKRSFYEVASPENCVLVPEDFKILAKTILEFFRARGEAFFHRKRHVGSLRHLVLRRGEATGEILVLLSATSALQTPLADFAEAVLSAPLEQSKVVGIMHAANDGVADAVKNENVDLLHGRQFFFEEICGLRFKISQFSFFQTNSRAAEVLYKIVKKFSGALPQVAWASSSAPAERPAPNPHELFEKSSTKTLSFALDLYCGTGTIAQIISPDFARVVGVEIVDEAIEAARENARLNSISNCEFHAGDAFEILKSFEGGSGETFLQKSFPRGLDAIILDPPRDGLHPKALTKIASLAAPRIVYVACKPKSLVRDLPVLLDAGYALEKIAAVDMFPRTPHVEAIALLRRRDS